MYKIPQPGERVTFHDLCGMAEFQTCLMLAHKTVTEGPPEKPEPPKDKTVPRMDIFGIHFG